MTTNLPTGINQSTSGLPAADDLALRKSEIVKDLTSRGISPADAEKIAQKSTGVVTPPQADNSTPTKDGAQGINPTADLQGVRHATPEQKNFQLPETQDTPAWAKRHDIQTAFKPQLLNQLEAKGISREELNRLSDPEIIDLAKSKGLYETAPISEAPVSRGGDMNVRGPANEEQLRRAASQEVPELKGRQDAVAPSPQEPQGKGNGNAREGREKLSSTQVNIPEAQGKPFVDFANSIPESEVYKTRNVRSAKRIRA